MTILDTLVIGAGPAGLTAAIYLARYRRDFVVVDAGASRATWIPRSHNHPGYPEGVSGRTLLELMREQACRYGAEIEHGTIETLSRSSDSDFLAQIPGRQYRTRTVLIATGIVDRTPELAFAADAVKRGLLRLCPICDGYEARGKRLAIIGHGQHAVTEARFMQTYTRDITVVTMGTPLNSTDRQQAADLGLTVNCEALTALAPLDTGIELVFSGMRETFDAAYCALGFNARSDLGRQVGANLAADGRFIVDDHQETNIRGLWAAGDIVRDLNQISVAMGEAAIAATAIHNRLAGRS
jgi:thioredoxin reductase (NADPH)